jgi:hypothetical protein
VLFVAIVAPALAPATWRLGISMNLFRSLGVAGRAYRSAVSSIFRGSFWLPFLVIAAFQIAVLGLLVSFHRPVFSGLGVPLVELLGGERATHYPFLYLFLPAMYAKAVLVLAIFVASLMTAVATLYFARALGLQVEGSVWQAALRRAPALILVAAIPAAAIYGLGELLGLVPAQQVLENSKIRWGLRGGMLLSIIVLQSLLAYTAAWIVLEGHRALPALRDSIRVAARTFLPTLIVVAIPVVLLYPLGYLSQRADLFVGKLRPETVTLFISARILAELLFGFLLVGAITRLFLWRMEASR